MIKVLYAITTLLVITGLAPLKARADGCAMIYMKNDLNATVHASPARAISLEFPRPYRHYRITNGELWSVDDASTGTPENVLIVGPRLPGLTNQGNAVVRFNGDQPSDPALHMDLYEPLLKLYSTSQLHVYTTDRKHYSLTVKVSDRHPSCYVFVDTEQGALRAARWFDRR